MRKPHALHNEQLCELLLKNGNFNDWVVTSAFYSALNFVKHQMFPVTAGGREYAEFDVYFHQYEKRGVDKHQSLTNLVCRNLNGCSGAYRWLLDASKLSRYNNYQVSPDKAKKAAKLLAAVKSHCTKE